MAHCPCGSKRSFDACCGPYIENLYPAPTAEALMRSRYTAYTRANVAYLKKTSRTGLAGEFDEAAVTQFAKRVRWLGLDIIRTQQGLSDDTVGEITYVARYVDAGHEKQIAEHARFQKSPTGWLYVGSSTAPSSTVAPKVRVGRNDPCPCGSGKKYKKCCFAS